MIYFLYGTDSAKIKKTARTSAEGAQKKKPDASIFVMTSENWSESRFQELLQSVGLFEQKYIVLLDNVFEDAEAKKIVMGSVKKMEEVDHLFFMLEGKVDKKTITKITKHAYKVTEYNEVVAPKQKEDNFALANAVGRKDKKQAWVILQSALERGAAPEALHGMLFWKVKSMLLAGNTRPFSKEELQALSHKLLDIHYKSRTGQTTLDIALERFVLAL